MTFRDLLSHLQNTSPVLFPQGMTVFLNPNETLRAESRTLSALMWADMDTERWQPWLPLTQDNLWDCLIEHTNFYWLRHLCSPNQTDRKGPLVIAPEGFSIKPGLYASYASVLQINEPGWGFRARKELLKEHPIIGSTWIEIDPAWEEDTSEHSKWKEIQNQAKRQ